ncbi:tetratricopeptide repeat protein [Sphingomonas piscis]|uniref:Tetratricopeptide repeat protein n=1 Tax=Sphingomonas piscis TaxID=2714943 RepID=A0A6G7YS34_9SPHN|nr:tetratricopeptide repeat protein [Sphingomonas piscis]QIK79558.1 tetratricopeptide repeat protein [Sphingomonas piscis]
MSKPTTLGSAVSAILAASLLAGCAAPSAQGTRASAGPVADKLGPATRAIMALNAEDFTGAVSWAEQAVQAKPEDADLRALLGTAYFGAGRFASAETAYQDALALHSGDPKVVLKLALVQVAQGKSAQALALLQSARMVLESADYGLALALAGQPANAVAVLEPAARARGADARVRQNLALSYALAGDWTAARTIAAQDVPADQLDGRIQGWMKLASPVRVYDQVAALTGVTPVADPGLPVRLALRRNDGTALAAARPAPAPAPVAAAPVAVASTPTPVQIAEAAPAYVPPSRPAAEEPSFKLDPVDVASEPFVEVPAQPRPQPLPAAPKVKPTLRAAAFVPKKAASRPIAAARGNSGAVVQIGAYGSPQRVAQAWNAAARRYSALRGYMPVSARFQSAAGIVYRLSVKGFGSPAEAKNLCVALRRSGGTCFVRNTAGDAPVTIAMR